jgi:hypothetical protein
MYGCDAIYLYECIDMYLCINYRTLYIIFSLYLLYVDNNFSTKRRLDFNGKITTNCYNIWLFLICYIADNCNVGIYVL